MHSDVPAARRTEATVRQWWAVPVVRCRTRAAAVWSVLASLTSRVAVATGLKASVTTVSSALLVRRPVLLSLERRSASAEV